MKFTCHCVIVSLSGVDYLQYFLLELHCIRKLLGAFTCACEQKSI